MIVSCLVASRRFLEGSGPSCTHQHAHYDTQPNTRCEAGDTVCAAVLVGTAASERRDGSGSGTACTLYSPTNAAFIQRSTASRTGTWFWNGLGCAEPPPWPTGGGMLSENRGPMPCNSA